MSSRKEMCYEARLHAGAHFRACVYVGIAKIRDYSQSMYFIMALTLFSNLNSLKTSRRGTGWGDPGARGWNLGVQG